MSGFRAGKVFGWAFPIFWIVLGVVLLLLAGGGGKGGAAYCVGQGCPSSGPPKFLGFFFIGLGVALALYYNVYLNLKAKRREELVEHGRAGQAIIKQVVQTGEMVNDQPVVKLDIEMHVPGLPVYEVKKRIVVPLIALGELTSGAPLSVYVDRGNKNKFTIDWGGGGVDPGGAAAQMASAIPGLAGATPLSSADLTPDQIAKAQTALGELGISDTSGVQVLRMPGAGGGEPDPIDQLQKLVALRDSGALTEAEFEQQKKRLLGEQ